MKTFFYRYTSPITLKLVQVKVGNFPEVSLAEARLKLQELKQIRRQGRCPRTEAKEQREHEQERVAEKLFTVEGLVVWDYERWTCRSPRACQLIEVICLPGEAL